MNEKIKELFSDIPDPRVERTKKYKLGTILFLVLNGSLAGVDSFIGYEDSGNGMCQEKCDIKFKN